MGNFSEGIYTNFKAVKKTGYSSTLMETCTKLKCSLALLLPQQLDSLKGQLPEIGLTQIDKIKTSSEPFYVNNEVLLFLLETWENMEKRQDESSIEYEELKKRNNLLFGEFVALRTQICEEQEKNQELAKKIEDLRGRGWLKRFINWIF